MSDHERDAMLEAEDKSERDWLAAHVDRRQAELDMHEWLYQYNAAMLAIFKTGAAQAAAVKVDELVRELVGRSEWDVPF